MRRKKIKVPVVVVSLCLLCCSCNRFYFDSPQPVGAQNVYELPKPMQGLWVEKNDSILIQQKSLTTIEGGKDRLHKNEVDTSQFFVLKNDKIYFVDEEGTIGLHGGFPYQLVGDSIEFQGTFKKRLVLGEDVFLRKVDPHRYILNIKRKTGSLNHLDPWWEVVLVDMKANGDVALRYLSDEDVKNLPSPKLIYQSKDDFYLGAKWTRDDFKKIIDQGGFSDTVMYLADNKKMPLKK